MLEAMDALESPPRSTDPFLWTDFIELRALIHPDNCFSRGDLHSLENRLSDTNDRSFSVETRWQDMMTFAGIRTHAFDTAYPFQVSEDGDTLEFNFDAGNRKQRSYLSLLLASLMRHIPTPHKNNLARYFEEASFVIFRKLMPDGAETRATWASGGDEAPYQGTLFEKMNQIAEDLRCTANFKERDFKPNNTGDGGIDLISWHPMADDRKGMPIAFAQCGCSKEDWKFKQLEASPSKHGTHLPVTHPWATYYFLPLDLRHSDGDWACASDIGQAIIVDRLRLIGLATQYDLHDDFPDLLLLNTVLEYEYS